MRFIVVALIALIASAEAKAEDPANARRTGEDLVENCSLTYPDVTGDPRGVYCLEYITGFVDSMWRVQRSNGPGAALFCLPDSGFTVGKAVELVMTYAEANRTSHNRRPAHIHRR